MASSLILFFVWRYRRKLLYIWWREFILCYIYIYNICAPCANVCVINDKGDELWDMNRWHCRNVVAPKFPHEINIHNDEYWTILALRSRCMQRYYAHLVCKTTVDITSILVWDCVCAMACFWGIRNVPKIRKASVEMHPNGIGTRRIPEIERADTCRPYVSPLPLPSTAIREWWRSLLQLIQNRDIHIDDLTQYGDDMLKHIMLSRKGVDSCRLLAAS